MLLLGRTVPAISPLELSGITIYVVLVKLPQKVIWLYLFKLVVHS
jgi:hypothetical protein